MGVHIEISYGKHTVKNSEIPKLKKIIQRLLWIIGFKPKSVYRIGLGKSIPGSSNTEVVKVISSQRTSVTMNILPGDNGSGFATVLPVLKNDSYKKEDLPALFFLALNFAAAYFCAYYDYRGDKSKIQKTNSDNYFRKNFVSLFFQREKKEATGYSNDYQSLLIYLNDFFEQLKKAGMEVQKEVRDNICKAYLLSEDSEQSCIPEKVQSSKLPIKSKESIEQEKKEEDPGVSLLTQYYENEEFVEKISKEIESLEKTQKKEKSLAEKRKKAVNLDTEIKDLGKNIEKMRKEQEKKREEKSLLENEIKSLENEHQQNLEKIEELRSQKEAAENKLEDLKKQIEENDKKVAEEKKKEKLKNVAVNIKKVLEEAGITAEDMANLAEFMKSEK